MYLKNNIQPKLIRILLVSSRMEAIAHLTPLFDKHDNIRTAQSESGKDAFAKIKKDKIDLVIIDEVLEDMLGLELAEKMVSTHPMINCAAISGRSPKEFHEASEGLGLLMQLPLLPTESQIDNLLSHLKKVLNLTAPVQNNASK